jgi:hypothetical protein
MAGLFPTRTLKPGHSSGFESRITSVEKGCIDLGVEAKAGSIGKDPYPRSGGCTWRDMCLDY